MENYKKDHPPPCHLQGRVRFLYFSVACLAAMQIVLTIFFVQFYGEMNTLKAKLANVNECVEFVDHGDASKKDSAMMPDEGGFVFGYPRMWSERLKRQVGDADDWMWMSSSARIPTKAIQSYCQEAKTYCAASGPPGLPGSKGDKGDKGNDGIALSLKTLDPTELDAFRGLPGVPGDKGEMGRDGLPGTDGLPGAKGDKGEAGTTPYTFGNKLSDRRLLRGPPGFPGIPGSKGENGHKGDKGDNGIAVSLKTLEPSELEALRGPPGKPGDDGIPGLPGMYGPKGDRGQDGRPGVPGQKGEPGSDGPPGLPGPRGMYGFKGENGRSGEMGLQGLPGPKGDAGKPGFCSVECKNSTETTSPPMPTETQEPSDEDGPEPNFA